MVVGALATDARYIHDPGVSKAVNAAGGFPTDQPHDHGLSLRQLG
jgi:hypothetical protein